MLGFSIQKLLFTVVVIAAVWYGFKWVGRMKEIRDQQAKDQLRRERQGAKESAKGSIRGGSGGSGDSLDDAEDMIECVTCGAFVSSNGARACGKDNCPYPG